MPELGSPNDPRSFIGYQLANERRGKGPRPGGCGLGLAPLLIGALIGLMIALFGR